MKWNIINTKPKVFRVDQVIEALLENRNLTSESEKKEFFNPKHPAKLTLQELGIKKKEVSKALKRINKSKKNNEAILIYGDYDADGVSATAVLWEVLHFLGYDVHPFIPDRFEDGYGLNAKRINLLKSKLPNLKLIITVDNGIVAFSAVEEINKMGIDVIITDHHQAAKKLPPAAAIVHTDKVSGSAVAWILARELVRSSADNQRANPALDMVAIGTVADILPLLGPNRSFVAHGLAELNKIKRPGLVQLCIQAGINADKVGVYEVAFVIAPRINSMGRLKSALDSLRLVCTKKLSYAQKMAMEVSSTNLERQKIVSQVVEHALLQASKDEDSPVFIVSDESYHEGVIGLVASKLVEKYYRPAIVISKGEKIAKASARSIAGFNIIENIRKFEHLIIEGGGHPLAAGFSIEIGKIEEFSKAFKKSSQNLLTEEILKRSISVDLDLTFELLNWELYGELKKFEPTGSGNKQPVFVTYGVEVAQVKTVGQEARHLKLQVKKDGVKFDAIGFNLGKYAIDLTEGIKVDIAYSIEENIWNGNSSLQLRLKDIHSINE